MNQKILLIEPNYKNKYPPIGLMKLATYHRSVRKDFVRFYKGEIKDLIIDLLADDIIDRFNLIDCSIEWFKRKKYFIEYIKYGRQDALSCLLVGVSDNLPSIFIWLKHFAKCYKSGRYDDSIKWDRIYITSLFTFHWNVTVNAINASKKLLKDSGQIFVGGVMATVASEQLEKDTGITPIKGLLDKPGFFYDDNVIIDELPLDYSILHEIDYLYPEENAYYGSTTRGCIRKCPFCAVPTLEPVYKDYISVQKYIECVDKTSGPKCNLLLLDNNVLASDKLKDIIADIKSLGFQKNSKFYPPNYLELAVNNLKSGYNDYGYRRLAQGLALSIIPKLKGEYKLSYLSVLERYDIQIDYLSLKDTIIAAYDELSSIYEKFRNKTPKNRSVDYNQGVDARLIDEGIMKQLAEIPIKPLRIAFDSMKFVKAYDNAIRLAAKYDIKNLSNYVLYNYHDKPIELYQRLKVNIDLCVELGISIYSFPMKYNPINDPEGFYQNRDYLGIHWNRKFIRAIQIILNATKGKVGRGKDFFEEAFGHNEDEFIQLLYMPEFYLFNRMENKHNGNTQKWRQLFVSLSEPEKKICYPLIESNVSDKLPIKISNPKLIELLNHYNCKR